MKGKASKHKQLHKQIPELKNSLAMGKANRCAASFEHINIGAGGKWSSNAWSWRLPEPPQSPPSSNELDRSSSSTASQA